MKNFTFIILFSLITANLKGQVLNQNANWPNLNWTITGTFDPNPGFLEANPRLTANFAVADGENSTVDIIAAESPVINLTEAYNANEKYIYLEIPYSYRSQFGEVAIQYWDAYESIWMPWSHPLPNTLTKSDYCSDSKSMHQTYELSISAFTFTQLSEFRYRIYYEDFGINEYKGFCFESPVIKSTACPIPTGLSTMQTSASSIDFYWDPPSSGEITNGEIVIQPAGTGIPSTANNTGSATFGNVFTASDFEPGIEYEFYVRNECVDGVVFSPWAGPFTFAMVSVPECPSVNTPADGAMDVPIGVPVTFSWTPSATGGQAIESIIYVGLEPGNLIEFGITTDTQFNYTLPNGFENTTIYWKIVPFNSAGSANGCDIWEFTTESGAPPIACFDAPYGQWPNNETIVPTCNGDMETIPFCYAGDYSVLSVTAGTDYYFSSSIPTDYITISADGGSTAAISGTAPITWTAQTDGEIMFFTHTNDECGVEKVQRSRIFGCSTTLHNPQFNNEIELITFPNPITEELNLSCSEEITSIRLFNAIGQEIISKNNNSATAKIDTTILSSGIYIIKTSTISGVKSTKIVKE